MTMFESLAGATDTFWTETAIVLALISSVLSFIAFIGTGWAIPVNGDRDPEFEGLGLWHHCGKTPDGSGHEVVQCIAFMGKYDLPAWFVAVQTLVTMGFLTLFITLVILVLFNCCKGCWHKHRLLVAYSVLQIVGVLLLGAGLIVFGLHIPESYIETEGELKTSWCFILMSVSCGLGTVTLGLAILQYWHMIKHDPWVAKRFSNDQPEGNHVPEATPTSSAENFTEIRLRDNSTTC